MAIRLRVVDGVLVALCAARSVAKSGDVYIPDDQHWALAAKFWRDYADFPMPLPVDSYAHLAEQEESNNPAREDWDRTYGA